MLKLLSPAAVELQVITVPVFQHGGMSLKRKASATLHQTDQQHPAKKAAHFGQTPDGSAAMDSTNGFIMPGAVIAQAACSAAGLGMQQQQQQHQRQENDVGDMGIQVSMPQQVKQLLLVLITCRLRMQGDANFKILVQYLLLLADALGLLLCLMLTLTRSWYHCQSICICLWQPKHPAKEF
jgi:hypothetical protein